MKLKKILVNLFFCFLFLLLLFLSLKYWIYKINWNCKCSTVMIVCSLEYSFFLCCVLPIPRLRRNWTYHAKYTRLYVFSLNERKKKKKKRKKVPQRQQQHFNSETLYYKNKRWNEEIHRIALSFTSLLSSFSIFIC